MTDRVLVVGGGITGLSAAYDLARAGLSVTVTDPADRWGGKVHTEIVDGFLIEHGPDSFVSYRPAAQRLADELGIGDQIIGTTEPRQVYLRRNGRLVPMPEQMGVVLPTRLEPFLRTRLFSWSQKLRAGADVVMPRRLDQGDVAIGAFLRQRLGDAVVEQLADPLFGGIYGTSVDELSLDAVLPQLRSAEREHRSLLLASLAQGRAARAARSSQPAGGRQAARSAFVSFGRGMGSLADALVTSLRAESAVDLRLGVSVTSLQSSASTTTAVLSDGDRAGFDAVVMAAPGPATARLLADHLPQAAAIIGSVRHASTAVVTLAYRADAVDAASLGHGFLEAGPVPAVFSGCTVSSNKWDGRAPADMLLLRVFVPNRSARLLDQPDGTLVDQVEREVAAVLGSDGEPVLRRVSRWQHAMPTYTVGHLERMIELDDVMRARPTWVLAGATYRGVGVPDCVTSGRNAAGRVLETISGH